MGWVPHLKKGHPQNSGKTREDKSNVTVKKTQVQKVKSETKWKKLERKDSDREMAEKQNR